MTHSHADIASDLHPALAQAIQHFQRLKSSVLAPQQLEAWTKQPKP